MKPLLIAIVMFTFAQARADIEYVAADERQPTAEEIARNRSCFDELAKQSCGDPGEDIKRFRTCLHDSFPSLSDNCKKMMSHLYSRKN